jgi:hypothetical protein
MFSSRSLCTESATQQHKFTFTWCTYTAEFRPTRRDVRRASFSTCTRAFSDSHREKPVLVSRLCLHKPSSFFSVSIPTPPPLRGFYTTYNDTPQSVGLPWTRTRPVAEASTWQHTTLNTDTSSLRWSSNPQSQQANRHRPSPQTSQPQSFSTATKKCDPGVQIPGARSTFRRGAQHFWSSVWNLLRVTFWRVFLSHGPTFFGKSVGPVLQSHLTATFAGRRTDHNCFLSTTPCLKLFPSNKYVPSYVQVKLEMTAEPRRF